MEKVARDKIFGDYLVDYSKFQEARENAIKAIDLFKESQSRLMANIAAMRTMIDRDALLQDEEFDTQLAKSMSASVFESPKNEIQPTVLAQQPVKLQPEASEACFGRCSEIEKQIWDKYFFPFLKKNIKSGDLSYKALSEFTGIKTNTVNRWFNQFDKGRPCTPSSFNFLEIKKFLEQYDINYYKNMAKWEVT